MDDGAGQRLPARRGTAEETAVRGGAGPAAALRGPEHGVGLHVRGAGPRRCPHFGARGDAPPGRRRSEIHARRGFGPAGRQRTGGQESAAGRGVAAAAAVPGESRSGAFRPDPALRPV